jgi:hypothetical protein
VLLKRWLHIPREEATFGRRNFCVPRDSVRARLELVGETFLDGYHAALEVQEAEPLAARLETVELEFRGFAFEGAAMALDLLDQLKPWRSPNLPAFLNGPGSPHAYMVHVGMGWSLARMPWRIRNRLDRLDPLLRWLVLDGYGFHEGYFHWSRYAEGASRPRRLRGYALRAFDQGLGRSMWFVGGADPEWIMDAIARFPGYRHSDLWSGVGLACAYAGGADAEEIRRLRLASGVYCQHLAQGVAFAAGARSRAANPAGHTELACELVCKLSAQQAADISDETRLEAREDSAPAYEVWRRLIRMRFPRPERLSFIHPMQRYLQPDANGSGERRQHAGRS